MSYLDDLDWLALNVHEWPFGLQSYIYVITASDGMKSWGGNVLVQVNKFRRFDKEEWLARRAELQNKPRFADHPDAKCFVQNDSGTWFKNSKSANVKPESNGGWFDVDMSGGWQQLGNGEVLGDWRDTLERRPADLSEPAVAERLDEAAQTAMAAVPGLMDEKYSFEPEFKPVTVSNETAPLEQPIVVAGTGAGSEPDANTSAILIADTLARLTFWPDHFSADELADLHQLCDAELTKRDAAVCGGQKYLDATWHERGELPPVGTECVIWSEGRFPPAECKIVAYSMERVCVRWNGNGDLDVIDLQFKNKSECKFRPIRTERDEAIEAMKAHCPYPGSWETTYRLFAESLYDAGYRAGGSE